MAASPWKQFRAMEPGRDYLVLASRLSLRRMAATPRMLGLSSSVRRQLKDTPGVIGYSLDARVFAKDYFTLSIWDDEAALRAFVAHAPHVDIMTTMADDMGENRFVTWSIAGTDARPTWAEARQRLG